MRARSPGKGASGIETEHRTAMKTIDVKDLSASDFYRQMISVIVPRPIAWVSTRSPDGVDNLAPFSYFTGVGSRPPTLLFCPARQRDGRPKDTMANIEATGEFVVNIVPARLAEQMNQTAASVPPDVSEFDLARLETLEGQQVRVARVKEAPVQIECRLRELICLDDGPGGANIVLGDILLLHMHPDVVGPDGLPDPQHLDAIGRMGGLTYTRTRDRFDLPRP